MEEGSIVTSQRECEKKTSEILMSKEVGKQPGRKKFVGLMSCVLRLSKKYEIVEVREPYLHREIRPANSVEPFHREIKTVAYKVKPSSQVKKFEMRDRGSMDKYEGGEKKEENVVSVRRVGKGFDWGRNHD